MNVKFKTVKYEVSENGIHQANMQDGANVLSLDLVNVDNINELTSEATGAEEIVILNGDEETQTYDDYINLKSINYDAEKDVTVVTVKQDSIVKQVESLREKNKELSKKNAELEKTVEKQGLVISEQAENIRLQQQVIDELTNSQAEQDEEITEIQEVLVEEV